MEVVVQSNHVTLILWLKINTVRTFIPFHSGAIIFELKQSKNILMVQNSHFRRSTDFFVFTRLSSSLFPQIIPHNPIDAYAQPAHTQRSKHTPKSFRQHLVHCSCSNLRWLSVLFSFSLQRLIPSDGYKLIKIKEKRCI